MTARLGSRSDVWGSRTTLTGRSVVPGNPGEGGFALSAEAYLDKAITLLRDIREPILPPSRRLAVCARRPSRAAGSSTCSEPVTPNMLAEEVFVRAGGLLPVNAVLVGELMLHEGGLRSGPMERVSGLADVILDREPVRPGDVMIVASNSGLNAVPVEMAELTGRRGLRVIAITSLMQSRSTASRAPSGKRLFEVAEVVIDNRGPIGDAVLPVPGAAEEVRMAAMFTVSGAAIVQAVTAETVARLAAQGMEAPLLASSNVQGSAGRNEDALRRLGSRGPSLLARELLLARDREEP
jgi:uncharacterized phosphosugar-binding protein